MKASNKILSAIVSSLLVAPSLVNAFEVSDIKLDGANRIGYETISSYLTFKTGQDINDADVSESIQRLYKTGFFKDVAFYKNDNGVLTIKVIERPSIAGIKIEGNSLIDTDALNTALDSLGIKKGRIYNQSQMDLVVLDLQRRYQNEGYYAAIIDIETEELPRERVDVKINITEGEAATIGRINLVGNKVYSDERLKSLLQSSDKATFGSGDKYSKPKLQADIETLKSYYLDRGFAEFKVDSSQVSISTDKTKVFSTINLVEGARYNFGKIDYQGELVVPKEEIVALTTFKEGDVFSRSKVIESVKAIRERFSEEGYAFAVVEPDSIIDRENLTVSLTIKTAPKDRVYIRRIEIEGNTRTRDHVVRREMRQLESAPYSLKLVRQSKERLQRLGFFQNADVETQRVSKDQVDLVVKVTEQPTGSISAGIGFSQLDGASFNLGVSERNFIGSGNKLNLNLATSASRKTADIGVTNPYFTEDGVSLGLGFYYSEINAEELDVADYTTNNLGIRSSLGYPLNENDRITYGLKLDSTDLICSGDFADKFCKSYIDENGETNNAAIASVTWVRNTTNAFYFPSEGHKLSFSLESVVPGTSNQGYYKLYANENWFQPLSKNFTLQLKGSAAYGNGFGNDDTLPFYEKFYAGGIGSVRGFEPNSLGPYYDLTTDGSDRPKGGSAKLAGTAALVFPVPLVDDSSNARMSLFYDAGNIYDELSDIELSELRSSIGLGVSWITPVGPLTFSYAKPMSNFKEDKEQSFQFKLGAGF